MNLRNSLLFALCAAFSAGRAQHIQNVVVEKYYIADENDAADTDGDDSGNGLATGATTYRVFLDLAPGCKLAAIYGDTNHILLVGSTVLFFNNTDRGEDFGHLIPDNRLDENTVAIDSWFSFGAASEAHYGVLKSEDPDTSIVGGENNDGGSEGVPGGLLVNAPSDIGIPLTEKDGLVEGTDPEWATIFTFGVDPDTIFGDTTAGAVYASDSVVMQCAAGVAGYGPDNKILIGQFTTAGDLSFDLNVEVLDSTGAIFKYVASGDTLLADETEYGLLHYPPECGCMDPYFLEYDPAAGCDDGSCQTPIVFGCTDLLACNYNANANFNIPALCCYGPDSCAGLDISIVCPTIGFEEIADAGFAFNAYPNPANEVLAIETSGATEATAVTLLDHLGRVVLLQNNVPLNSGVTHRLDLSSISRGAYVLVITVDGQRYASRVMKQ